MSRTPALTAVLDDVCALDPKWHIETGVPAGETGWIAGDAFRSAAAGPFADLLRRTGERMSAGDDSKTVAALFALRYGWASAAAIVPAVTHGCVLDVSLDNVAFKFKDNTLFERTAILELRGDTWPGPLLLGSDVPESLRRLRSTLRAQAAPVVDALHAWSGFSRAGAWGMVTSSWAAQFIGVYDRCGGQPLAAPVMDAFFAGDDSVAKMRPRIHPVSIGEVTHLYQRRASCCRYYLLPKGSLCTSCPLVPHDERLRRNREWMQTLLARRAEERA